MTLRTREIYQSANGDDGCLRSIRNDDWRKHPFFRSFLQPQIGWVVQKMTIDLTPESKK